MAFAPLGWRAAWFSEIEAFPSSLLAHRYPAVPNLGDMTRLPGWVRAGLVEAPDVLCGGTPCQAFSVAGLRKSLADERGGLSLTFCELANAIDDRRPDPCVILWENVPGVFNTPDNAFGCFLAGLAGEGVALEPPRGGRRWADAGVVVGPRRTVAWRTLDAQYFGLAQRRRRVFVVASARPGFDPVSVLFEFDGVRRDTAPSREAREETAGRSGPSASFGCEGLSGTLLGESQAKGGQAGHGVFVAFGGGNTAGPIDVAAALNANKGCANPGDFEAGTLLVFDPTQITSPTNRSNPQPGDACPPLAAAAHPPVVAFNSNAQAAQLPGPGRDTSVNDGLTRSQTAAAAVSGRVRRLTPEECEALQGFPRGYTRVPLRGKPAKDAPRYRALGNSWPVPVVAWIGRRIHAALTQ